METYGSYVFIVSSPLLITIGFIFSFLFLKRYTKDVLNKAVLIASYTCLFMCIFLASFYVHDIINYRLNEKTVVQGNGSHYIIMLHGFMGAPDEFQHLRKLFDKKNYTVIIPYDKRNFYSGLDSSVNFTYNEIKDKLCKRIKNYECKISIIGNSWGGLVAKLLIVKLKNLLLDKIDGERINTITFENFITTVTPHFGIGKAYKYEEGENNAKIKATINAFTFGYINKRILIGIDTRSKYPFYDDLINGAIIDIRILLSYLTSQTGRDLRDPEIFIRTETEEFRKIMMWFNSVINYSLFTYDLNVPDWSSIIGRYDTFKEIQEELITQNKSLDKDIGCTTKNMYDIHRIMCIVPINSFLNHGNLIGKHLDRSSITPNREEVENSIRHIRNWFK